ncbi:hypothetical protein ACHAPT_008666 [Fusarium lateritium]
MDSRESSVRTCDSEYITAMVRYSRIQAFSSTHERKLRSMRSPKEDFEREEHRLKKLGAEIDEQQTKLDDDLPEDPNSPDAPECMRRMIEIKKLRGELQKGIDKRASVGQESVNRDEAIFQERCVKLEKKYFFAFLEAFDEYGRDWAIEFFDLQDRIRATDMATPHSISDDAPIHSPGSDGGGDLPGGDDWDVPHDVEDEAPLNHCPNSHLDDVAAVHKRRRVTTDKIRQKKRPRHNDTQVSLTGDRTIEFDEVFQGGNAPVKYKIARYPPQGGEWYILECREHPDTPFHKDPVKGAAKHLDSEKHGHMGRATEQAVRILGTRVLGCNQMLAEKNNAMIPKTSEKGVAKPTEVKQSKKRPRRNPFRKPIVGNRNVLTVNPEDICASKWPKHLGYYPAFILPRGECWRLRYSKSGILETGLLKCLPSCYVFDSSKDTLPQWAPGYEDGGPRVAERLYPVAFFMDSRFPDSAQFSWVPAVDMKPYDKDDKSIRYRDQVEDFLSRRHTRTESPSARGTNSGKFSTVGAEPGTLLLTMAVGNSDRQDSPSSDDAIPEDAEPTQRLSPYPELQRILERTSREPDERNIENEHGTGIDGDNLCDRAQQDEEDIYACTDESDNEEGMIKSTYSLRDRRQRRMTFQDEDIDELAAESEAEHDDEGEDDRPPSNDAQSHERASTIHSASPSDEQDGLQFPFNNNMLPDEHRQSREVTIASDQQSYMSEMLRSHMLMNRSSSADVSG